MTSNIDAAFDEAGKVVKKQKTCADKTDKCFDQLIKLATDARDSVSALGKDPAAAIQELLERIEDLGLTREMNNQTKELHSAVSKLNKALDKSFDPQVDVCKALREVHFDNPTLNQVIAEHFFREGRFDIGEQFIAEAGLVGAEAVRQPFVSLHAVLKKIKERDLQPALVWAEEHRSQLSSDGTPSAFEFRLHALNFVHMLTSTGQHDALSYAKAHFSVFQHRHMRDIQRLMGCLLYSRKPLDQSPYADLLAGSHWDEVAREFTRQACSLMGQSYESPLAVTVAGGAMALPALLKLAAVMEKNQQDLRSCEQLPIELELGPEFVFHSIFACPVSREQSHADNVPMLLPCNHVLCEQSILRIAKNRSRVFKCPYCPMEARADNLRPLFFPTVE